LESNSLYKNLMPELTRRACQQVNTRGSVIEINVRIAGAPAFG